MRKLSKLSLAILLALPVFYGCSSMQPPSPGDTKTGPGSTLSSPSNDASEGLGLSNEGGDIPANIMQQIDSRNIDPALILCTVHFDFDQYNIRADQRADLEAAAKTLAGEPGQKIVAVGYTDWYGSEQYDLALGDKRANSVKTFATKLGASDAQIETLSKGKLNAPTNVGKESPEARASRVCVLVKLPSGTSAAAGADASAAPAPAAN